MKLDENMKKIDEITVKLESSELTIGEGVKLYEEGVGLAKECLEELNQVKGKITILKKELDAYREEALD